MSLSTGNVERCVPVQVLRINILLATTANKRERRRTQSRTDRVEAAGEGLYDAIMAINGRHMKRRADGGVSPPLLDVRPLRDQQLHHVQAIIRGSEVKRGRAIYLQ